MSDGYEEDSTLTTTTTLLSTTLSTTTFLSTSSYEESKVIPIEQRGTGDDYGVSNTTVGIILAGALIIILCPPLLYLLKRKAKLMHKPSMPAQEHVDGFVEEVMAAGDRNDELFTSSHLN